MELLGSSDVRFLYDKCLSGAVSLIKLPPPGPGAANHRQPHPSDGAPRAAIRTRPGCIQKGPNPGGH